MGIHSDISRLHQKIRECEEGIAELEEAREYIDNKYRIIQEDAYEPAKNFDITCGEQFRGKMKIIKNSLWLFECRRSTCISSWYTFRSKKASY
ncbi:hypothetical protein [Butyrivibrio hungatei]|uniref:hypothetical protein n=1 Tax=Butyrivibrio hungatei TaxID=185008 RepID=UPI000412ECD2|nr:hypothetical protein [Butyrivibrio hungatei]